MRWLIERFKAWWRGDVRTAPPHAKRGRLYGKRALSPATGGGLTLGKADLPLAHLAISDGVTAPVANVASAQIYVDSADGDLKVKFGDGVVKTLATDV